MQKRSGKKQDLNERTFSVVQQITGEAPISEPDKPKNPAAVALGRLGGLKGGKARSEKMTDSERSESARNAAKARWGKISPQEYQI